MDAYPWRADLVSARSPSPGLVMTDVRQHHVVHAAALEASQVSPFRDKGWQLTTSEMKTKTTAFLAGLTRNYQWKWSSSFQAHLNPTRSREAHMPVNSSAAQIPGFQDGVTKATDCPTKPTSLSFIRTDSRLHHPCPTFKSPVFG
jgi:hypothetical protein